MIIYHGSEQIVARPEFEKGRKNNDYGQGFYCTEDLNLAREWAVDYERDGFVNTYELDLTDLRVLNLNSGEWCILHWLSLLLRNRRFELDSPLAREAYRYLTENFLPNLTDIDIIVGYRADDSYFSYAQDFISGIISVSQLSRAMRLGELGEQIFLKSRRAFERIRFIESESVSSLIWYDRKKNRDLAARRAYRNMNKEEYISGELYMIRIIDEEVKPDDPRLQ